MEDAKKPALWRRILAGFLDFLTAFIVLGFAIAALTGGMTDNGFQLNGAPALLLFALLFAYFWVGRKYLGGTLWQRILKAR